MPICSHKGAGTICKRNTALHRFNPSHFPPEFGVKIVSFADADCKQFAYRGLRPNVALPL